MTPRPKSAIAVPASSGGRTPKRTACDTVMSAPPPTPWMIRHTINVVSECAEPQKKLAAVKNDDGADEVALAAEQVAEEPRHGITMTRARN